MTIKGFNNKYQKGYVVKKLSGSEQYLFLYVIGNSTGDGIAGICKNNYFNFTGHGIEREVILDFVSIKF